jgi:HlyD family secretion protein
MCTFIVNNVQVDRQQVSQFSIRQRSDLAAEIRQGVKQGDVVVLHPTEQIKTGDRVNPR